MLTVLHKSYLNFGPREKMKLSAILTLAAATIASALSGQATTSVRSYYLRSLYSYIICLVDPLHLIRGQSRLHY